MLQELRKFLKIAHIQEVICGEWPYPSSSITAIARHISGTDIRRLGSFSSSSANPAGFIRRGIQNCLPCSNFRSGITAFYLAIQDIGQFLTISTVETAAVIGMPILALARDLWSHLKAIIGQPSPAPYISPEILPDRRVRLFTIYIHSHFLFSFLVYA